MSRLLNDLNNRKNQFINNLISINNNYNKYTRIILPLISIFLAFGLVNIILKPIKFANEKDHRYKYIKEKLIDIRSAQLAFKEKKNRFASSFEELIPVIKKDSFIITQRTDTVVEFYNKVYREMQFKDTLLIDTLGKVSILDSLFGPKYHIDSIQYVPFNENLKFELRSGTINKSKITVHVFEAKDPQPFDKTDQLIIGSMTEASLNGNWQ